MLGTRLRQARLRAGLTLDQLAARLNAEGIAITKAALSKYELGKSVPRATLVVALARIVGARPQYFLDEPDVTVDWYAFRKGSTMSMAEQARVKAEALEQVTSFTILQGIVRPHDRALLPPRRRVGSMEEVEDAADELRDVWLLGRAPIESVTGSAEDNGAVIVELKDAPKHFDGLSGCTERGIPVAVVKGGVSDDCWRFNLAHEFGHCLLEPAGEFAGRDEQVAFRFAGAFLAPREAVARELSPPRHHVTMSELALLKQKYGMSMQAWAHRACDLGVIRPSYYRYLCTRFSASGWRTREPVDFQGFEKPTRRRQMALQALAERVITEERALELSRDIAESLPSQSSDRRSLVQLLRSGELSRVEVDHKLRSVAESAAVEYEVNPKLKGFEAFGDDDFFDQPAAG